MNKKIKKIAPLTYRYFDIELNLTENDIGGFFFLCITTFSQRNAIIPDHHIAQIDKEVLKIAKELFNIEENLSPIGEKKSNLYKKEHLVAISSILFEREFFTSFEYFVEFSLPKEYDNFSGKNLIFVVLFRQMLPFEIIKKYLLEIVSNIDFSEGSGGELIVRLLRESNFFPSLFGEKKRGEENTFFYEIILKEYYNFKFLEEINLSLYFNESFEHFYSNKDEIILPFDKEESLLLLMSRVVLDNTLLIRRNYLKDSF